MENIFGISNDIVKQALKTGIKVKKNGNFEEVYGVISLSFVPQWNKFVLAYGTCAADAAYVLVDNFEKDWILK